MKIRQCLKDDIISVQQMKQVNGTSLKDYINLIQSGSAEGASYKNTYGSWTLLYMCVGIIIVKQ